MSLLNLATIAAALTSSCVSATKGKCPKCIVPSMRWEGGGFLIDDSYCHYCDGKGVLGTQQHFKEFVESYITTHNPGKLDLVLEPCQLGSRHIMEAADKNLKKYCCYDLKAPSVEEPGKFIVIFWPKSKTIKFDNINLPAGMRGARLPARFLMLSVFYASIFLKMEVNEITLLAEHMGLLPPHGYYAKYWNFEVADNTSERIKQFGEDLNSNNADDRKCVTMFLKTIGDKTCEMETSEMPKFRAQWRFLWEVNRKLKDTDLSLKDRRSRFDACAGREKFMRTQRWPSLMMRACPTDGWRKMMVERHCPELKKYL